MAQIFKSPAAYVQGRDVAEEIGSHAEELGEEAVLIADEIVLDILEDRVLTSLEDAGLGTMSVEFNGEASETEIDRITSLAEEQGLTSSSVRAEARHLTLQKPSERNIDESMVSMPTVASTDAPTSALSVIYSEHGEFQEYRFYEDHPDLVLVDTAIIADAPTRFFRSGDR